MPKRNLDPINFASCCGTIINMCCQLHSDSQRDTSENSCQIADPTPAKFNSSYYRCQDSHGMGGSHGALVFQADQYASLTDLQIKWTNTTKPAELNLTEAYMTSNSNIPAYASVGNISNTGLDASALLDDTGDFPPGSFSHPD